MKSPVANSLTYSYATYHKLTCVTAQIDCIILKKSEVDWHNLGVKLVCNLHQNLCKNDGLTPINVIRFT